MAASSGFLSSWQAGEGSEATFARVQSRISSLPTGMAPDAFARLQDLIYQDSGVWLPPARAGVMAARLAERLKDLSLTTFKQYLHYVAQPHGADERVRMLEVVLAEDSHFFREAAHFEFLAHRLLPRWQAEAAAQQRPRRVRVWCAGCGGGEEAFSIAMLLRAYLPRESGWEIEVLASDISQQALTRAAAALWPVAHAAEIPHPLLKRFMLKGMGEQSGWMKAGNELLQIVRFARLNLLDGKNSAPGMFDLIFCRNVLGLFGEEVRLRVQAKLTRHISPRGFIFLGHADKVDDLAPNWKPLSPTIYAEVGENGRFRYDFRSR